MFDWLVFFPNCEQISSGSEHPYATSPNCNPNFYVIYITITLLFLKPSLKPINSKCVNYPETHYTINTFSECEFLNVKIFWMWNIEFNFNIQQHNIKLNLNQLQCKWHPLCLCTDLRVYYLSYVMSGCLFMLLDNNTNVFLETLNSKFLSFYVRITSKM